MEINKTTSKDQIIFIEKTDLAKPLSEHSKLIENLAENDPSNPGIDFLSIFEIFFFLKHLFILRRYHAGRYN